MTEEIKYPDHENGAYVFHRGELTIAGKIFIAFTNIKADQPTENGAVHGTRPFPLTDTEGTMDKGEGSITWSDEAERVRCITALHEKSGGKGYRTIKWQLMWILSAPGRPNIKKECFGCRMLSDPTDDEYGSDAIGGETTFSFQAMSINGMFPHAGMQTPTSPAST